jgi:serine/threonine-protein phosphatase 2A regulatory subunit A
MGVTGVLTRIIPCLQQLVIDGCEHVRAALASVICELAPLLGQVNG